MDEGDARLASTYFAGRDQHVRSWQTAGGPWRPYAETVPVDAMKAAALLDDNARVRREALGVLDHAANDESSDVFRAALADPVPRVRLMALHALSCEHCRLGEINVADTVTDVLRVLAGEASPKVRHAAIDVLCRFASRDGRVLTALRSAAMTDPDALVRTAAGGAARGERHVWSRKAVGRRERADMRHG